MLILSSILKFQVSDVSEHSSESHHEHVPKQKKKVLHKAFLEKRKETFLDEILPTSLRKQIPKSRREISDAGSELWARLRAGKSGIEY